MLAITTLSRSIHEDDSAVSGVVVRFFKAGVGFALAAALVACGGGGDSQPAEAGAESPAPDPTAFWPVKPMLGTWNGTLKYDPSNGCGPAALADQPTSFTVSSADGVAYTVTATPAIVPGIGEVDANHAWAQWSGEWVERPTQVAQVWLGFRENKLWYFTQVAPDRAEVTYAHVIQQYGVASCVSEIWAGEFTRAP